MNTILEMDTPNGFDANRVGDDLDGLMPNARLLKRARFFELFPRIKAAKERGVPVKKILGMLMKHDLKIGVVTFNRWYAAAEAESGNVTPMGHSPVSHS